MTRLGLCLVLLVAFAGCRSVPEAIPADLSNPRWRALIFGWNAEAKLRKSMRGTLRLAVDAERLPSVRSTQSVAVERPGRLRVEVQGFLNQTVAVLTSDAERYQLFRTDDRSLVGGEVHPGLLWEHAYIGVTPEEAIDLLLGAPILDPTLSPRAAYDMTEPHGGARLEMADDRGVTLERGEVDRDGNLIRLDVFDERGLPEWGVSLRDFQDVSGFAVPHEIDLEVRAGNSRATLTLSGVELNPDLPEGLFQLREEALVP